MQIPLRVEINMNLYALGMFLILSGARASPAPENNRKDLTHGEHREPRELRMLTLKDPLDCLSQVICGLNTYPPLKPSVRTTTANDFAFLLKSAILKLRSQTKPKSTTTTVAPVTTKKTTTTTEAPQNDDDEEVDYEPDDMDGYYGAQPPAQPQPPPIPIDKRHNRVQRASIFNERSDQKRNKYFTTNKKEKKLKNGKKNQKKNGIKPTLNQKPMENLTPLDRLRMETDLRAKLLSNAQCGKGLIDHSCPFNYDQMMSLMSSALERERTVSYTTNKVLPMVGYLIKSRNYTGTLEATFSSIERINNYTIEADQQGKPVDFSHILDEVINRSTGDNGIRIVDTSNDSGSSSVWEDDEFDHVLENPYVRKKPASASYTLPKHKKAQPSTTTPSSKKVSAQAEGAVNDDQSSEEDTSEEGLAFDRPRPPYSGPSQNGPDSESSSEEDDEKPEVVEEEKVQPKKKKYSLKKKENKDEAPPPVFGHLQKSAEEEK